MIPKLMMEEKMMIEGFNDVQVGRWLGLRLPPRIKFLGNGAVCRGPRTLYRKSTQRDEMIVYRDALIVNRAQASSVCNRWGEFGLLATLVRNSASHHRAWPFPFGKWLSHQYSAARSSVSRLRHLEGAISPYY